jgi:hypothetical protein
MEAKFVRAPAIEHKKKATPEGGPFLKQILLS